MDLIIVEVPQNLHVMHVLDPISSIPKWNVNVDNYIVSIFIFVDKYIAKDGSIFFFYDDNFQV